MIYNPLGISRQDVANAYLAMSNEDKVLANNMPLIQSAEFERKIVRFGALTPAEAAANVFAHRALKGIDNEPRTMFDQAIALINVGF